MNENHSNPCCMKTVLWCQILVQIFSWRVWILDMVPDEFARILVLSWCLSGPQNFFDKNWWPFKKNKLAYWSKKSISSDVMETWPCSFVYVLTFWSGRACGGMLWLFHKLTTFFYCFLISCFNVGSILKNIKAKSLDGINWWKLWNHARYISRLADASFSMPQLAWFVYWNSNNEIIVKIIYIYSNESMDK